MQYTPEKSAVHTLHTAIMPTDVLLSRNWRNNRSYVKIEWNPGEYIEDLRKQGHYMHTTEMHNRRYAKSVNL